MLFHVAGQNLGLEVKTPWFFGSSYEKGEWIIPRIVAQDAL